MRPLLNSQTPKRLKMVQETKKKEAHEEEESTISRMEEEVTKVMN